MPLKTFHTLCIFFVIFCLRSVWLWFCCYIILIIKLPLVNLIRLDTFADSRNLYFLHLKAFNSIYGNYLCFWEKEFIMCTFQLVSLSLVDPEMGPELWFTKTSKPIQENSITHKPRFVLCRWHPVYCKCSELVFVISYLNYSLGTFRIVLLWPGREWLPT